MNLESNKELTGLCPTDFILGQNYPNPFEEKTSIEFCVPCKVRVRLEVIDPDGKRIETLMDEEKEAGTYEVEFPASVDYCSGNRNLPEGVYVYQLHAGALLLTKMMRVLRQKRIPETVTHP